MRILVTGATGYVGRPLVSALVEAGHSVHATVRGPSSNKLPAFLVGHHIGDMSRQVDWSPVLDGMDVVIHLAAIAHIGSGVPEIQYDLVNRQSTLMLAGAAARAGIKRFIFVSSIRAQTGPVAEHILTEADHPHPTDAYGRSKLAAEAAVCASGVPYTVLRPVVIYGPGMKGNLATLARMARLPVPLPFASLHNRRSLLGIDAMIRAVLFSLDNETAAGETYLVADAEPITFAQIISSLRAAAGRSPMLFPCPASIFRWGSRALGRPDLWERLGGNLIASPARLISAGWLPEYDSCGALARLRGV